MKQYFQRTLKDTFLTWLFLVIGITISAILYAIMKVEGVSENTSLLVAFIILAGLVILSQAFSAVGTSKVRQFLEKRLLDKQKSPKQLEVLIVAQNQLLKELNQTLANLSTIQALERLQPSKVPTFQLSDESLLRLDSIVKSIISSLDNNIAEQRSIALQLEQIQQKEQNIIAQLDNITTNQQETTLQQIRDLAAAQRSTLEKLVVGLSTTAQKADEEASDKVEILSSEGKPIGRIFSPPLRGIPPALPATSWEIKWQSEGPPIKDESSSTQSGQVIRHIYYDFGPSASETKQAEQEQTKEEPHSP